MSVFLRADAGPDQVGKLSWRQALEIELRVSMGVSPWQAAGELAGELPGPAKLSSKQHRLHRFWKNRRTEVRAALPSYLEARDRESQLATLRLKQADDANFRRELISELSCVEKRIETRERQISDLEGIASEGATYNTPPFCHWIGEERNNISRFTDKTRLELSVSSVGQSTSSDRHHKPRQKIL